MQVIMNDVREKKQSQAKIKGVEDSPTWGITYLLSHTYKN
jgi:hypothetical protein